jgi:hypothetical protein
LGSVFSVYPGWDMDNGGTTSIFGGTEIDCRKACRAGVFRSAFTMLFG